MTVGTSKRDSDSFDLSGLYSANAHVEPRRLSPTAMTNKRIRMGRGLSIYVGHSPSLSVTVTWRGSVK